MKPLTIADVARELGKHPDTVRKQWRALVAAGMPPPVSPVGHPRWDAASFYAWRGRHHPAARTRLCNDNDGAPPIAGGDVERWRTWHAQAYGSER